MKTCHEIRKSQLRALVDEVGGVTRLSDILGKTETQIRQWLNASRDSRTGKPRGIADDMARFIENASGKPTGWLDNDPDLAAIPNWSALSETQRAQVLGFSQGLLSQNQATQQYSHPFSKEGRVDLSSPAPKAAHRLG